ncbi:MAG: DUF1553 domain-containing protein [Planctomycetes bacterium]|nr:DUF1553 domain-containing protein [Planctomycetota bacterium]
MEAHGLRPGGPAERRALIRRATFDLTGLPPTPEEVGRAMRPYLDALAKLEAEAKALAEEQAAAGSPEAKAAAAERLRDAVRRRAELEARRPPIGVAYAVAEGPPRDARVHERGDPRSFGAAVPRRFLAILGGQPVPAGGGSGRSALAHWLSSPENPLTARVMANRVWQHQFGAGIVSTPNDFGTRGAPPTHPELLDWLASRLVEGGWSLKALHRTLLLSQGYQLSSDGDPENERIDPDATWLWRFRRHRLSAEEIRDAILASSGDLDLAAGGPHPFPEEKTWGFTQHNPFSAAYDHDRRSVYLMTQRLRRHPFLGLFDGPDASSSTAERHTTTVPTQALYFMNDRFVHAKAASLASRLLELPDDRSRMERASRLLFARPPAEGEHAACARFLAEQAPEVAILPEPERLRAAWTAWARVLLGTNEMIHVD